MTEAVYGIKETLAALKEIDPALRRSALKQMRQAGQPLAAAVSQALPGEPPISGMARGSIAYQPGRARKASIRTGGRASPGSDETPLVKLFVPDGAAMAADMAGKTSSGSGSGVSMIAALSARYGSASRFVYPAVEANMPTVVDAVKRAAEDASAQISRKLVYKGGSR